VRLGAALALLAPLLYLCITAIIHGGSQGDLIAALIDGAIYRTLDMLEYVPTNPSRGSCTAPLCGVPDDSPSGAGNSRCRGLGTAVGSRGAFSLRGAPRYLVSPRKGAGLQGRFRWRDPDSNRGHHDFQDSAQTSLTSRNPCIDAGSRGGGPHRGLPLFANSCDAVGYPGRRRYPMELDHVMGRCCRPCL